MTDAPGPTSTACAVDGCTTAVYARGWCERHYRRQLRTGSTDGPAVPGPCAVEGCDRTAKTRGWCHAHYQRWRRHGSPLPDRPLQSGMPSVCTVDGCERSPYAKGLCSPHYRRDRSGDLRANDPIRVVGTGTWIKHGYRYVVVPLADRHLTRGSVETEHRLVMAQQLGRPLAADENVHHRNGDRLDNRAENLELWSRTQPAGQRVTDLVAHALEILRRHAPEHLADVALDHPGRLRRRPGSANADE